MPFMRGLLCLSCLIFECALKNLPYAPLIIWGIRVSIWGIWGIIWGDLGNLGNYLGNLIAQIPKKGLKCI